jgi:aldehyde dehydrogenase (NAD+)
MRIYDKLFIGGRWVAPSSSATIEVRSPHDQSLVGRAPDVVKADVDQAVAAARKAFDEGPWPRLSPEERQAKIARFNELYAARALELAELMTAENGLPISFTGWFVPSHTAMTAEFLREAKTFQWEEQLPPNLAGTGKTLVVREPVGVVAALVPWNAPHLSGLAKIVPALLAGCTIVCKWAPETALDAFVLAEIVAAADLPPGVFSIFASGKDMSEYLVAHPSIDKIAFTGSPQVGATIAATAGKQHKRVGLELGGKNASIILDDVDIESTAEKLKLWAFAGNGESCGGHSRVLAPVSLYDKIVDAITRQTAALKVGDPRDPATEIGPMATAAQQKRVLSYIEIGLKEGARLTTGGLDRPDNSGSGYYVRPTVFADVRNDMRIAQEEIFGPVVVIIPYKDEEDAIRIANDSPFGLSGGVWANDVDRATAVARRIRTGTVIINGAWLDLSAPFGGFKASGSGREGGVFGLHEYTEIKAIVM